MSTWKDNSFSSPVRQQPASLSANVSCGQKHNRAAQFRTFELAAACGIRLIVNGGEKVWRLAELAGGEIV